MLNLIAQWIKFPYVWLRYGAPVRADETVVLFPQSAHVDSVTFGENNSPVNTQWTVPVHAWVVEKEDGTLSRFIGRHSLLSSLHLLNVVSRRSSTPVFESRLSWFMVDREMNKKVSVSVGGRKFVSPRTSLNGHVKFNVPYEGNAPGGSVINSQLVDLPAGKSAVQGQVQLVPQEGLSIVSDIDDTIKISDVTDKRQLVAGLFFNSYKPAPGMPEFYQKLLHQGAMFHYVSASPWQLYPSLAPFLDKYFPFGCLAQRHFYIGDKSFIDFFLSSMDYKIETVSRLLTRFPQRKFILIGDSGEKDPEVYLAVAKRFKSQVLKILIREVYIDNDLAKAGHQERWDKLKSELLPEQELCVFHDPAELEPFMNNVG